MCESPQAHQSAPARVRLEGLCRRSGIDEQLCGQVTVGPAKRPQDSAVAAPLRIGRDELGEALRPVRCRKVEDLDEVVEDRPIVRPWRPDLTRESARGCLQHEVAPILTERLERRGEAAKIRTAHRREQGANAPVCITIHTHRHQRSQWVHLGIACLTCAGRVPACGGRGTAPHADQPECLLCRGSAQLSTKERGRARDAASVLHQDHGVRLCAGSASIGGLLGERHTVDLHRARLVRRTIGRETEHGRPERTRRRSLIGGIGDVVRASHLPGRSEPTDQVRLDATRANSTVPVHSTVPLLRT